jgi:hypothetical protein
MIIRGEQDSYDGEPLGCDNNRLFAAAPDELAQSSS